MRSVISLSMVFAMAALMPCAANARSVKQSLRPTGVEPNAQGVAAASIHAKANRGRFRVSGRNLKPGKTFGISVAGVRIGSLTTNAAGAGVARFTSPQRANAQHLGVDPRGKLVEVSDDQGEDVMEAHMPDDADDQGNVQCCLADDDDDGAECEETTADECATKGGTNLGTGTCFPNPCPTSQPMPDIQCCLPDDDGPECEEESAAECSADGGVNMGTGSCVERGRSGGASNIEAASPVARGFNPGSPAPRARLPPASPRVPAGDHPEFPPAARRVTVSPSGARTRRGRWDRRRPRSVAPAS